MGQSLPSQPCRSHKLEDIEHSLSTPALHHSVSDSPSLHAAPPYKAAYYLQYASSPTGRRWTSRPRRVYTQQDSSSRYSLTYLEPNQQGSHIRCFHVGRSRRRSRLCRKLREDSCLRRVG